MAKRPAQKTLTFSSFSRCVGENSFGAVTPEETLGTLHTFGVGTNKTKQHSDVASTVFQATVVLRVGG